MVTAWHRGGCWVRLALALWVAWRSGLCAAQTQPPDSESPTFGKLPLRFEVNQGQSDAQVRYLARGRGYTFFLTPTETVLTLRKFESPAAQKLRERGRSRQSIVKSKYSRLVTETLRLRLVGGNPQPKVTGSGELGGRANYFIGNDPARWLTDVPLCSRVRYESVYPGIAVEYYGDEGRLEYDFVVGAGADPSAIRILVEGPGRVTLDGEGRLVLEFPSGSVLWRAPVAFQEVNGQRRPVGAQYRLHGSHQFGFELGSYDHDRPLIIDPALEYSTYLGGTSDDSARAIALDAAGFVYVTGDTASGNFPTRGPISGGGNLGGDVDVFITKLGPKGTNIVFSTYLGGNGFESGQGIAVDAATNVYVTGFTDSSTTFPTRNPYQSSLRGADDVFVSKLNAAGNSLLYSTYIGGTNDQAGLAIACDNSGGAYVTGDTMSRNFPTKNAFQSTYGGAFTNNIGEPFDAFVTKFNTTASGSASLIYSSFLGGNDDDVGNAIAVDTNGVAYVVGYTYATNFPTTSTAILASSNSLAFIDAFVVKVSASGSNLVYSTLLSGSDAQQANAVALDRNNLVYVAGQTTSTDFPVTVTAFMSADPGAYNNVFVTKLDTALAGTNAILYSTYLGGSNDFGDDSPGGIAAGTNGLIYVAGMTGSMDFPVSSGAFQPAYAGGFCDGFVTVLNPNLAGQAGLFYSSYLGGPDDDRILGLAVDAGGGVYVCGETVSTNFPATGGAFQRTNAGSYDAFVSKIVPSTELGLTLSSAPDPVRLGDPITFSITVTNIGELTATGTTVTNVLPPVASYVSATPTTGTVSQVAGVVTWNVGTLATGRGASLTIVANAIAPGLATNIATIGSPQTDGNTNNNRATTVNTFGSLVDVTATISNAAEAGPVLGRFRIGRTGDLSSDITVNFTVTGTAAPGNDYVALPGSATIAANLNAVLLTVTPINDLIAECPETVVLTVTPGSGYAIASPSSATVTIADDELPTVSVVATQPNASETGPTNGVFTLTRGGCSNGTLVVNYTISGTASNGVDFNALNGVATFADGSSTASVIVRPINDNVPECAETVTLTIASNASYIVGSPNAATVTIADNDPPVVTVAATQPNASEAGTNGVVTVFRSGCTTGALTVNFTYAGTATLNTDYLADSSVSIAAGATNATVAIRPLADALTEGAETVILRIAPSPGNYTLGAASNATVTIADYVAPPTAQFTGSPTTVPVPSVVTFSDNSIGTIATRAWDFGDGSTTNLAAPSAGIAHLYSVAGTNTVSLTVAGPQGTDTQTRVNYIIALDIPPQLTVTPANRNFGTVTIGQTATQSFAVINTGGGTLSGSAVVPAPFAIAGGSPFNLLPGQTGMVAVAFAPTLPGTFNANVLFNSNAGNKTNAVTAVGVSAGQIAAIPSSLNFGFVPVGSTAPAALTVTNLGGTAVSNGTATVTGGPFTIGSGGTFNLTGFGSTNVVVNFTPPVAASFTNAVIVSSANGGSSTNALIGTGAVGPVASFAGTPTSGLIPLLVDFSDTSTGTITNRFWNFGDGVTTNTTATNMVHTYTARGTYTVTLIVSGPVGISTNNKPGYIAAQSPAQLMISPTGRDFGSVIIGQTNTLTFSVINAGDLTLTGAATTAGPFSVAGGSPFTIGGGQTGTVTVSFMPVTPGTFTTNVVFNSNGGVSTNGLSGIGVLPGQIVVTPSTLNFGTVATGSSSQRVFTVTNTGGSTVTNGTAAATGGPYSIVSGSPFTLPAGGSTNVTVQFAPVTVASFTNLVAFNTANGGSSSNIVIGTGAQPPTASFTATPTTGTVAFVVTFTDTSTGTITNRNWSFGDGSTLNTNATSVQHTYTVAGTNTVRLIVTGPVGSSTNTQTNLIRAFNPALLSVAPASRNFGSVAVGQTGTVTFAAMNVGDAALSGTATAPAPYFVAGGSPYNLAPGQTGTITVGFTPPGTGTFNDNVTFASNGGASTNALSGFGVPPGQIGVSPGMLDFGLVATGSNSQLVFTVTNGGGVPVTNGTATASGLPFTVVAGASFSVAAGSSTNVTVRFEPTSAGGFTGSVVFATANGGNSTNAVVGTGAVAPTALFSASPTNGAAPLTVTFNDASSGTIASRSWSFGDGGTTNTTSTNLAYTYAAPGTNTVRLIVSGPVGSSTNTKANLIVVIKPPQLAVSPASRDFGSVTIGQTNSLTFSVINTGDLTLAGTASAPAPFGVAGGNPYTVLPGQTGTVTVTFGPTTAGPFNAIVTFASNGGASTNAVSGTGLTPGAIGVSPVGLDFGVLVTGTVAQLSFTVSNSGGTPVSNGVATVGGPFSIVSGATFSVPAGGSTNVTVRFSPSSAGAFSNNVIFTTANGGNSTNPVSGSGAIVPVANFTASPTNGTTPLTVTFADTSSGTINTRSWSFGDGGTLTTTSTNIQHTYTGPGTNTVRLIVTGPVGVSTNTKPNLIVVVRPPQQLVTPAARDFGAVTIGETNTQSFFVVNTGDLPLNGSASVGAPFAVAGSPYNVNPGQTGVVQVSFLPTSPGTFVDNVIFTSNGGISTNEVAGTGLTPGQLGVSPVTLNFGALVTGTVAQLSFTVSNSGGTDVTNGTATVTGGPFTIVSGATFDVPAGGSTNVVVQFAPVAAGSFTNSVIFDSANGGGSTNTLLGIGAIVPVANFGASPTNGVVPFAVAFSDTSTGTITNRFWSFGDGTTTNTTSTNVVHTYSVAGTNTVQLIVTGPVGASTNTKNNLIVGINPAALVVSPSSLHFGSVTIGLSNTLTFSVVNGGDVTLTGTVSSAGPFAVTGGSPYTVLPHQTGAVTVAFAPQTAGTFNANVTFASNGGVSTNAVAGVGLTPGRIGVSPVSLNFGVLVTGTVAQLSFTVSNSGGTTVSNGTATVTGGPYSILSGSPFALAAGASTNVVVQFAPMAAGGFTNNVIFNSANGGSSTNAVTGTGAVKPTANFTASPTNGVVAFDVTFSDTSTGTITNRLWDFGDGSILSTTSGSVVHTYTVAGTNTVRLIVTGPVGVSTNTKPNLIVGINPPQLNVTPPSLNFGSVTIGLTNTLTFTIINTGDLTLNGTADASAPFAVVDGNPYSVPPQQTGTVSVAFAPTASGAFNQNVTFGGNGGVSTNNVSGVGLTPGRIAVSPSSLDFGTIATGATSQRVFTVTNIGGTAVSNGTASVSTGVYSIVSGSPFALAAGASTNVVVQFAPLVAGGFTNSVLFSSANGGSSTNVVSGTGAVVPVAVFSATPTNGPAPLQVTFSDASSGTITNRNWSFGDGSTLNTNVTTFTHAYTTAGTYTVRLIATGPVGVSTNTRANLIRAVNPAQLVVAPSSLSFGAVTIGLSNSLTFSVINAGDLPLSGSASVGAPFAVSGGGSFNLNGGQTGTVTVVFAPATAGGFGDNVVFSSNGGGSTNAVDGVGLTPGKIGVTPAALDFGVIATGTTSQRVFTVTNSGGTTVSNGTATVTGGPYTIVSGATFSLLGGASTNVVVRFAPIAVGSFTNAVLFNSANGGSSTNPVTGSGAIVPVASFTASPTNGAVPLTVTFSDTSTGTITNRFWSFGDGTTLNTNATTLTHTYLLAGSNTVQLIASGPLGASTNTRPNLIVGVNPPRLVVNTPSLDFGAITVGLTNNLTMTIVNTGDLVLTGSATVAGPFAIAGGGAFSIGGGQTGTVTVSFRPVVDGTFNNNVVFNSNGGGSTNPVTGVGLTPGRIVVSPPAIDYATVAINSSRQGVFTVSNAGGTPVSNGVATVTGGPFAIVSGDTFNLPAGGSANIVVSFTPTEVGTFSNEVRFSSANGGSSTNPVVGAGAFIPVADFSAAPTEGLMPLTVAFADESSGTIVGRQWSFGDGNTSAAASPSHTYTNSGIFTVSLSVFGPAGTNTMTKANLITVVNPNLFLQMAGTFHGLSQGEPPSYENSGLVVFKLTTKGSFKGTYQQGKTKTAFGGQFDSLGDATTTLAPAGLGVLTMVLHLDGNGTDQITGVVSNGTFTAELVANRLLAKTGPPTPYAGKRYTLLLPANTSNTVHEVPLGDGFGTVLIKAPGAVTLAGYTGDGQKFKQKSFISKFGTWAMYAPLYNGLGAIFGWVTHTNVVGVSDLDGPWHWRKPPGAGPVTPAGFEDNIFVVGAEYTPPIPGRAVLTVSNRLDNVQVILGEGNLPGPLVTLVTLTPDNKVVSTNLTMKIVTPTGLFTGKFTHPVTGAAVPFRGAFLQKQNFGAGFFLGADQSGFVNFEPAP